MASAVKKAQIRYPVILDNDYSTWQAYKNRYWPRKYLIDIDGYIVYDHIGEGAYEETEKKIQELLGERAAALGDDRSIAQDITIPGDVIKVNAKMPLSPEVYFGSDRNELLANGRAGVAGVQTFSISGPGSKNELLLGGSWDIHDEYAENQNPDGKIVFRYQAQNVYFVADAASPVIIDVYQDGKMLKKITIDRADTYQLIADENYGDHVLEIRVNTPGLKAFTFTFG